VIPYYSCITYIERLLLYMHLGSKINWIELSQYIKQDLGKKLRMPGHILCFSYKRLNLLLMHALASRMYPMTFERLTFDGLKALYLCCSVCCLQRLWVHGGWRGHVDDSSSSSGLHSGKDDSAHECRRGHVDVHQVPQRLLVCLKKLWESNLLPLNCQQISVDHIIYAQFISVRLLNPVWSN